MDERANSGLPAPGNLTANRAIEVGCDLAGAGRPSEALRYFQRAADLGEAVGWFNLGNTFQELGLTLRAIETYRKAIDGGEGDAWLNLGNAYLELGDLQGAIDAYRAASDSGDSNGTLSLAFSMREIGAYDEARELVDRAASAGNLRAEAVATFWRWDDTHDVSLEEQLRAAADHYEDARTSLAKLLSDTDRPSEALAVLREGAALQEQASWLPLGNRYCDMGDTDAAEGAYRSGIDAGDAYCHYNLGVLLEDLGRDDEAEVEFRRGAEAGDLKAAMALETRADR